MSPPPPCAIVIFGANGDLTRRLIVPALYNLARTHLLPRSLSLIGVDHNKKTSEEWKAALRDFLGQILAKNNEEIDETQATDIIVTASKFPVPLLRYPGSVAQAIRLSPDEPAARQLRTELR